MTSIKPTGTPGGLPTDPALHDAGHAQRAGETTFPERLAEKQASGTTSSATPQPAGVTGTSSVLSDLQAGRITPDEAVRKLTDQAVERSGAPTALRHIVEKRIREMLTGDPLVGELLRQMGATLPSPK